MTCSLLLPLLSWLSLVSLRLLSFAISLVETLLAHAKVLRVCVRVKRSSESCGTFLSSRFPRTNATEFHRYHFNIRGLAHCRLWILITPRFRPLLPSVLSSTDFYLPENVPRRFVPLFSIRETDNFSFFFLWFHYKRVSITSSWIATLQL